MFRRCVEGGLTTWTVRPSVRVLALGLTLLLATVQGCGASYDGPERGAVEGSVSLDGQPVETGMITFLPDAGTNGPTAGGTIENGRYEIEEAKGPAVGKYRVQISASKKTGKKIPAGSPLPPGTMIDETKEAVPAKYNTQTELVRDVAAGDNTFDFDLQSK